MIFYLSEHKNMHIITGHLNVFEAHQQEYLKFCFGHQLNLITYHEILFSFYSGQISQ